MAGGLGRKRVEGIEADLLLPSICSSFLLVSQEFQGLLHWPVILLRSFSRGQHLDLVAAVKKENRRRKEGRAR